MISTHQLVSIKVLGRIISSVDAQSVTLSADGTKAFVADGSSGLQIIDLKGL